MIFRQLIRYGAAALRCAELELRGCCRALRSECQVLWRHRPGRTAPSIKTLEKLCAGFQLLPNDLLVAPAVLQELTFRLPLDVTQCSGYASWFGITAYPVCPRCRRTFEREYQAFCDRCGQRLCWRRYAVAGIALDELEETRE